MGAADDSGQWRKVAGAAFATAPGQGTAVADKGDAATSATSTGRGATIADEWAAVAEKGAAVADKSETVAEKGVAVAEKGAAVAGKSATGAETVTAVAFTCAAVAEKGAAAAHPQGAAADKCGCNSLYVQCVERLCKVIAQALYKYAASFTTQTSSALPHDFVHCASAWSRGRGELVHRRERYCYTSM